MARKKEEDKYPDYKSYIDKDGRMYFYAYYRNKYGKYSKVYAKTRRELYYKVTAKAEQAIAEREDLLNPTVADYCETWLKTQEAYLQPRTIRGYRNRLEKFLIAPLGDRRMSEITADTLRMALLPVSEYSVGTNESVNMLVKSVFYAYEANFHTGYNPAKKLRLKGGVPQKERPALTDEQVKTLLETVKGLPPELFIKLGLYAGLRREESLGLKWDSVFLDKKKPYIWVRRAWHCEHNRSYVDENLKSPSANRKIPIPRCLADALREEKEKNRSEYVIADSNGNHLNDTQFQRFWNYVKVRTAGERKIYKWVNGQKIEKTLETKLGDHCVNRPDLVCTLDFKVSSHQLRYTYITNLIYKNVDPKTVQYLAGHKNSKTTMDVYARVKYNRPAELAPIVKSALSVFRG